jgi:xylulokinase
MTKTYLMGVDIGTYSSKGVLVESDTGEVVNSCIVEHSLSMPKPGWMEHDPDKIWWGEFVKISKKLLESSKINPKLIKGIGVSGIGICVVPIDEDGNALRQGILYGIDTRASKEILELEEKLGKDEILQLSASHLSASVSGPKILWIKHNEPEVYKKARWFLTSHSFIVYRLTGRATVDIYSACGYAPLIDVEKISWNKKAADLIVPIEKLPDLVWSSEVVGSVSNAAAKNTGLAAGTPVIAGTIDAAAEALSAGLSEYGDMMIMLGSSNSLILKCNILVRTDNFWGLNWVEPNAYAVVGGMSTVGSLTRWFRDNFAPMEMENQIEGGENAYASIAKLALKSPPGSNGLVALPYFEGERTPIYDPDAKGVLFGLSLKHTRADIYRAILEGVGFGIRHNIESMTAEGLSPKRFLAVGGGTKNLEWMQMISDITNVEMIIPEKQIGSAYGDAVLAAVGVGILKDFAESKKWIQYRQKIMPNPENSETYGTLYSIYRRLYEQNKNLMAEISEFNRTLK